MTEYQDVKRSMDWKNFEKKFSGNNGCHTEGMTRPSCVCRRGEKCLNLKDISIDGNYITAEQLSPFSR